ncbi:hypothetical protein [Stutzerimonas stutzeri]|jgi:hypothetical protein|uniref:hypothetical protein n=1 Tax=Stutzerimonas stutzeri TaxID=316 RepID=UPI0011E87044|nr:hypothetical protein [Stutzerimonas stutzeri]
MIDHCQEGARMESDRSEKPASAGFCFSAPCIRVSRQALRSTVWRRSENASWPSHRLFRQDLASAMLMLYAVTVWFISEITSDSNIPVAGQYFIAEFK